MLTELRIANFAIIDELSVSFDEGMNVITGETGAGKSMIVEAVSLLLGDRASADVIRAAEDTAQVEAVFKIEANSRIAPLLEEMGFAPEDELCIRRVISRVGRSRAYINGTPATLGMLAAITENLVNICSQHEHQAILNADNHIDILDEFGGLLPLRNDYRAEFLQYRELLARRDQLQLNKARALEREEFLRFQLQELTAAEVKPGEDRTLSEERARLGHAQKLKELATGAYECLYGRSGAILEEFSRVITALSEIQKIDPGFRFSREDCDSLYYQLEDLSRTIRDYAAKTTPDPRRLAAIDDRLEILGRLKRKYGGSLENILSKREEISRQLTEIASLDDDLVQLEKEIDNIEARLREKVAALSALRREKAALLKEAVEGEIRSLKMPQARFSVALEKNLSEDGRENWQEKGGDQVEFFLCSNLGEEMKPLNRIASGGELSRIILAMKKALAAVARVETIVFDEVDSGIGGATAQTVGKKLREAARYQQILCITHLPQIACFGHRHYRVEKKIHQGRTIASMELLSAEGRVEEIARMLGGISITEMTLAHAREMLQTADQLT